MGLTGVEGRGCRYSGCKMWPVRAVSIFSTLMGRRLACRRGSEGGTACTKGLVLPAGDETEPWPEQFPESALVQAGSALPLLPPPPLCLLLLRAESEGAVLMTHPRAWEQRGEGSGTHGAGSGLRARPGCGSGWMRSWLGGRGCPACLLGAWSQKRIILSGPQGSCSGAGGAGWSAGVPRSARRLPRAAPCAMLSRPRAGAALRDVSCCLSSRGSGEETHFKSSCNKGEIKAFAAFQSNGSLR